MNEFNDDNFENMPNVEKSPQAKESLFKKIFFHKKLNYIIISILSIIIFILVLAIKGFDRLQSYLDASFVVCVFNFCAAGLSCTTREGVFDSLGYGFDRLFKSLFTGRYKYKDLVEFRDARIDKRNRNKYNFAPYLVIGLIFMILTIILYFINKEQLNQMI